MKLPKIGLRGAVKTRNGNRAGSPLKHDPFLIELMMKLPSITVQDSFNRWRAEFLERLEEELEPHGSEISEDAYGVFRVKMEKLVRSITKIAHYVNNGNLSLTRVSSKAHIALNEGMISCETIASRLKYLAPPGAVEEDALGFTRYHTATILIRDSFEQFEKLKMCKDILQVLRDKVVDMVAGRHMIMEMDKFVAAVETFTSLMMEDVGLVPVLRKQRQLKPPIPPKPLMAEMRGDVVKQALIERSKGNKQSNQPTSQRLDPAAGRESDNGLSTNISSGHKPKSSRLSVSDTSGTSESNSQGAYSERPSPRKASSFSKRRERKIEEYEPPRRIASMTKPRSRSGDGVGSKNGAVRKAASARNLSSAVAMDPDATSERRLRRSDSSKKMPEKASSFSRRKPRSDARGLKVEETTRPGPEKVPSFSRRRPRSDPTNPGESELSTSRPEKVPSFSRRRPRSEAVGLEVNPGDSLGQSTDTKKMQFSISSSLKEGSLPLSNGSTIEEAFPVERGLVKFEPRKPRKSKRTNAGDDDNRSVVSISSKKKAKMKAKLARKGKRLGKSSALEKIPPKMRKRPKDLERAGVKVEDLVKINEGYGKMEKQNIDHRKPFEALHNGLKPKTQPRIDIDPENNTEKEPIRESQRFSQRRKEKTLPTKSSDNVFARKSQPSVVTTGIKAPDKEMPSCPKSSNKASAIREEMHDTNGQKLSQSEPRKHRYNSSVIDKHKKLMSQSNGVLVPSETAQKPQKPKLTKTPSKMKLQWPPKAESPITTKKDSNHSRADSKKRSKKSQQKPQSKKSLQKPSKSDGNGRQKQKKKVLPSLLDDHNGVEPEEEDTEILNILHGSSHSHSSNFEKRRDMFENIANGSTVSLDFRTMEDEDEEDIDPLDLLRKPSDNALDASTHSFGVVSEKRSIYENLSSSRASLGNVSSSNRDEDLGPLDFLGGSGRDHTSLNTSLRSQGSVHERRAIFENSNGSISAPINVQQHEKVNGNGVVLISRTVAELGAANDDASIMFVDGHASDEFSSNLQSLKRDGPKKFESKSWVHPKDNVAFTEVPAPDAFDIHDESSDASSDRSSRRTNVNVETQSGTIDEFGQRSPQVEEVTKVYDTRQDSRQGSPATTPQLKSWERPDSPLKKKKPWERQGGTDELVKMWSEPESQPWNKDAAFGHKNRFRYKRDLELEISCHGGTPLEISQHSLSSASKSGAFKQQTTSNNNRVPSQTDKEQSESITLSSEEKSLLVAGEVTKMRIEEEARKRALDKVQEGEKRRAEELAKRKEDEEALRMAEEVFRLEVEDEPSEEEKVAAETAVNNFEIVSSARLNGFHALATADSPKKQERNQPKNLDAEKEEESKSDGLQISSGSHHRSKAQSWRAKAYKSPLDGSEHQTYDKPMSSTDKELFSGRDHLSKAQPWRAKAWGSPLDGSQGQVFQKQVSAKPEKVRKPPARNRSVLSQSSSGSIKIFEDTELCKSGHEPTQQMKFKPVSSWATPAEELKKPRDRKTRSAIAAKKPSKQKIGRTKPQIADDSSVVKRKKSNRHKGQVTYTKTVRPASSARRKNEAASSGWAAPLKT
ncbi:MAG: hypothetical protein SGILL_003970 [Bacillariaceae sp.]